MKLASVEYEGVDRVGVLVSDYKMVLFENNALNMLDLIELGSGLETLYEKTLRGAGPANTIDLADVTWQPPIRRPGKICGIAMNNSASNTRKISAPDHPAFFLKPSSCLNGHGQPIRLRPWYGSVHPEPELAVVIGRLTRDIAAAEVLPHIFGYSIMNDLTGNGMRASDMFHYWALYASEENPDELVRREQHLSYAGRYKGSDTFGCFGPTLVTADEIDDPDNLAVTCKVGGEVVAEDSTRYYNYRVAELVSYISQYLTLEPGDVISCGTAFKPSAKRKSIHHANLQQVPGPVEISIEGLGTLVNPVVIENQGESRWRLTT